MVKLLVHGEETWSCTRTRFRAYVKKSTEIEGESGGADEERTQSTRPTPERPHGISILAAAHMP